MKKDSSLKQEVYDAIYSGIISDEYQPGQIINEKQLVEKFGCSKAPVREALISLCSDNVLHNIPRYGYEVIKLTTQDILDILRFRQILESGCLRACYKQITAEQLEELTSLNHLCCNPDSNDDMTTHWAHNQNFHLKLMSFANNAYAYRQLRDSMAILRRAYSQFYHDKWQSSIISTDMKSHSSLIRAIKIQDIEKACSCIQEDLADFGF